MKFSLPDLQNEDFFPFICSVLLGIHIILMIIYLTVGSYAMVGADFVSLAVYATGLKSILPKKHYTGFMVMVFIETLTHVVAAVLALGWNCGFQLWYFGLICAFYMAGFVRDRLNGGYRWSVLVSILYGLTYYLLYAFNGTKHFPRGLIQKTTTIRAFHLFNLMITVVTISYFTYMFTQRMDEGQKRLHRRADYDELTGLYNRYLLNYLLSKELESIQKDRHPSFLAIVDIDFFKKVNDNYGHNVGDTVLKQIADHFRGNLRNVECFGRWGGEEFVILSKHGTTKEEFIEILEGLRKSVERSSFGERGQLLHITISIGLGEYAEGMTAEDFVKAADDHLYEAKQNGRNRLAT